MVKSNRMIKIAFLAFAEANRVQTVFVDRFLEPDPVEPVINYVDRFIDPDPAEPVINYVDRFITPMPSIPPPPSCGWMNWGAWAECRSVCGVNTQRRIRHCDDGIPGKDQCCQGRSIDNKACSNPIGEETCAYWSGWGEWGSCSTSCGEGYRRKNRVCNGQDIAAGFDCDGSPYKEEQCNLGSGDWFNWGSWSTCSATCGQAVKSRIRRHSCDVPEEEEVENCNLLECCDPLPWSQWTACSATCFTGSRQRTHGWTCDYKKDVVQTEICNAGDGFYSDWSAWGACSQTCAGGVNTRTRDHSCGDRDARGVAFVLVETGTCGVDGNWGPWGGFSQCSTSCEGGVSERSRQHECSRLFDREQTACGSPGDWLLWSDWSVCSTSCFGGNRYRRRNHACSTDMDVEKETCGVNGEWLQWTNWSGCSQSCLGGQRTRQRFHSCGAQALLADPTLDSATETETELCGSPGEWNQWNPWTGCSASCGGGFSERKRFHLCTTEFESEDKSCNDICCPAWVEWSQWSACSSTCGSGTHQRVRENVCPSVDDQMQTASCFATLPDDPYNAWSVWSTCSASCPGGIQTRRAQHLCNANPKVESTACGAPGFWMEWSQWSTCDVTCGLGKKIRQRAESCGDVLPQTETADCDAGPGTMSLWTAWGACSQSCPGGVSRRSQYNTCTRESNNEERSCGADRWSNWSLWSTCSQSCVGGVSRRLKTQACSGAEQIEDRECGVTGNYLNWSPWTVCSTSCAGGVSTRSREHTCGLTDEVESVACGRAPYHHQWSFWTNCQKDGTPVLCGGGIRSRNREGFCGFEDEVQEADCNTQRCCYNTPWSDWSDCSTSCGSGYQSREIFDCDGNTVQTERKLCTNTAIFENWSVWTSCSVSCGRGLKSRDRFEPCSGTETQTATCEAGACPYWNLWTMWSSCSASCGEGLKTRTRDCLNEKVGIAECDGDAIDVVQCFAADPGFSDWAEWTQCSASCGPGFTTRSRYHICSNEVDTVQTTCNVNPGEWSEWSLYSTCSASCNGGIQARTRAHTCTGEVQEQTVRCNTHTGTYGLWSEWSTCSKSCYGGQRYRSRSHSCGLDDEVQTGICGSSGSYSLWTEWSSCPMCYQVDEVPVTSSRARSHSCGASDEMQEKTCLAPRCAYWSLWGAWSSCSTSCGMGSVTRIRSCQGTFGCDTLAGADVERMSCNGGSGRDYVGAWSPCSTTCGTGFRSREVRNTCSTAIRQETEGCSANMGTYSNWSQWGACSASCGGGLQNRRKTHSCGEDDFVQERSCNMNMGGFGPWSEWSACGVTCGGSTTTRSRRHSCTGEVDYESTYCNTYPCAYYGAWSNWSPCSTSCGIGSMNRIRYCHGGRVGDGLCIDGDVTTQENVQCDMGDCCNYDWSGWTGCCRDTQNRQVRLRFQGGCSGSAMNQEAKQCGVTGQAVIDSCMVVIQNAYQLGIVQTTSVNAQYVINPDEFENFQGTILTGTRLGHDDASAFDHTLNTGIQTGFITTGSIPADQNFATDTFIQRAFTLIDGRRVEIIGQEINGNFVATTELKFGKDYVEGYFDENNVFVPIMFSAQSNIVTSGGGTNHVTSSGATHTTGQANHVTTGGNVSSGLAGIDLSMIGDVPTVINGMAEFTNFNGDKVAVKGQVNPAGTFVAENGALDDPNGTGFFIEGVFREHIFYPLPKN